MPTHSTTLQELNLNRLRTACSTCSLRELCLPVGLSSTEMDHLDELIKQNQGKAKGDYLYRAGSPFNSLYAIRTGFFKTSVTSEDGREQVTGFHMAGEIMGMDAISSDRHACDAIALEDSRICEIPFSELEHLSREIPALQRHFYKIMSREIVRDQGVMMLLGNMNAEERLAAFLLNLSQRFAARGYSSDSFNLKMRREEIGSYLGLKIETISRTFSKFQDEGWLTVQNKLINIQQPQALRQLLGQCNG